MRHVQIILFGKVQGVGFRWATLRNARRLGITGFARNEPVGSLYIEAEGEDIQLDEFIRRCTKGPLWAKVARAELAEGTIKNFTDFEII